MIAHQRERKNVWKWIDVLDPDPELTRLICHSLGYSTWQAIEEVEAKIDAMEKQDGYEQFVR